MFEATSVLMGWISSMRLTYSGQRDCFDGISCTERWAKGLDIRFWEGQNATRAGAESFEIYSAREDYGGI
ncbi:hypothetical protein Tco_0449521 [Tanacetum coccineum]